MISQSVDPQTMPWDILPKTPAVSSLRELYFITCLCYYYYLSRHSSPSRFYVCERHDDHVQSTNYVVYCMFSSQHLHNWLLLIVDHAGCLLHDSSQVSPGRVVPESYYYSQPFLSAIIVCHRAMQATTTVLHVNCCHTVRGSPLGETEYTHAKKKNKTEMVGSLVD